MSSQRTGLASATQSAGDHSTDTPTHRDITSHDLVCTCSDGPTVPLHFEVAVESYQYCLQHHILAEHIKYLQTEHMNLVNLNNRFQRLRQEHSTCAANLRSRIERLNQVIMKARAVWIDANPTLDSRPGFDDGRINN